MQPEIEVKFLNVNHDELRQKLTKIGATCAQPKRVMKRKNYDFPDGRLYKKHGWVRVRDEGKKVTLSYKQLDNRTLEGMKEICLTVSSFDTACNFVEAIGLEPKTYQVTKRESWRLPGFEIELDEWPWVKPYIEIEGPDETSLKDLTQKLGLDWQAACFGSVEIVYRAEYNVTDEDIDDLPVISFDTPIPGILQTNRK